MGELTSQRSASGVQDAKTAYLAGSVSGNWGEQNREEEEAGSLHARLRSLSKFGFLVLDEFTTIALSSAIEVLRIANRLTGTDAYSWALISPHPHPVVSNNGFVPRQTTDYANSGDPQIVFVCGGTNIASHVDQQVMSLLRRMARDGVVLGGMCSGTYALAKAGLLDGYRCTIHWENLAGLSETHRNIEFLEELFVIDRDRITCAGGIAPIDMMLSLVHARFGKAVVAEISDQLILDRVRDSRDRQRVPFAARVGLNNPVLAKVAALMEANLESPLAASQIARSAGLSLRQLQRMFNASLQMTLTEYYLRLRLRRGRELLLQSKMSITEIAFCCGFHSTGQFSKGYRSLYGRTPRSERRQLTAAHSVPA